ncbi:MAG: acyl-CoA dehydrogenase family protein [Lewinellaceae bacterium]|nr:acyl-CoA dehydrogenase family protein [Phaeodactylibacter sp.]MCB9351607.1 acyl-CoA dehydrogenase family protein [Lewinellaceae bacterium]
MDFQLSKEQKKRVAQAREFALAEIAPYAAQWDQEEHIPRKQIQKYADAGYFGMAFPIQYGGRGLSALDAVLAIEEIARHCAISGRLIVDHNFGAAITILQFGTEEQRRRVLPTICSGETLMSIGMTEPNAGSALTELTTSAIEDGGDYIINGTKHWITGAGEREYTLLYARFNNVSGPKGIGAILIHRDMPGFEYAGRIPSLGVRGVQEGILKFNHMRVPKNNLVVPAGSAFGNLMSAYNGQRVGASAVALGIAQGAFDFARDYAGQREQFGHRVTDFQAIQFKLADMAIGLDAARYLIYRAAANADSAITDRYESSVAKVFASEMAIRVTSEAIQLCGAQGYSRRLPLERMFRDARCFTLAGGTAEMQRIGIAVSILGRTIPQNRGQKF